MLKHYSALTGQMRGEHGVAQSASIRIYTEYRIGEIHGNH